jgi:hypothetical protein
MLKEEEISEQKKEMIRMMEENKLVSEMKAESRFENL